MATPGVRTRPSPSPSGNGLRAGAGQLACGLLAGLLVALLAIDRRRAGDVAVLAVVAALAPASIVVGLRRHRPARAGPWLLIALGVALLGAAAALRTAQSGRAGPHLTAGPHGPGALLPSPVFVPGVALLVLGAAALAWSPTRRDRRNLDLVIEAALVGALAFSVSWAFWVGSTIGVTGTPSLALFGLAAAVPLAAMFATLVVSGFNRPPWRGGAGRRLLVGGAGLVAWTVLAQLESSNRLAISVSWLECSAAVIALVLAAAALHPTMRPLSRRSPAPLH